MLETEIIKNQYTYNAYYRTYKAQYVKTLGLPLFSKDNYEKSIEMNLYSKSRAKKDKVEITDEIGGFYRMQNGYTPLYYSKIRRESEKIVKE